MERSDHCPDLEILSTLPSPRRQLWRVLRTLTRKGAGTAAIPAMSVSLPALRADPHRLQVYRALCGFDDAGLPVTYPQVQAAALQVHLLTRPEFPLPLLGLVHVRNTIRQLQRLDPACDYGVRVDVIGGTPVPAGVEFSVVIRYDDHGTVVWEAVVTGLWRDPHRTRGPKGPASPAAVARLEPCATFDAPSNIGRRYGRASGDLNPIHLWRVTGRLFGLRGHIAHGMWAVARCLTLLPGGPPAPPCAVTVEFKQPLLLPARVSLLRSAEVDPLEFALTSPDRTRVHLVGSIRGGLTQEAMPLV